MTKVALLLASGAVIGLSLVGTAGMADAASPAHRPSDVCPKAADDPYCADHPHRVRHPESYSPKPGLKRYLPSFGA